MSGEERCPECGSLVTLADPPPALLSAIESAAAEVRIVRDLTEGVHGERIYPARARYDLILYHLAEAKRLATSGDES